MLGNLLSTPERKVAVAAIAISMLALLASFVAIAQVGALNVPGIPGGARARIAMTELTYEAPTVQITRFQYWFGKGYLNVSEIRMNLTDTRQSGEPATYNVMVSIRTQDRVINSFATRTLNAGANVEIRLEINGGVGVQLDRIQGVTIVVQRVS